MELLLQLPPELLPLELLPISIPPLELLLELPLELLLHEISPRRILFGDPKAKAIAVIICGQVSINRPHPEGIMLHVVKFSD